jgi:hypothetical protein
MAKKKKVNQGLQNTSDIISNSFNKGLNKDSDPSFVSPGMWTHAINIVNNTREGDVSTLSNESSNFLCITAGKTMPTTVTQKYIIGAIYLYSDKWIIFTTGHNAIGERISSEIGLLEEDVCSYREIVQDACLNFDKRQLISGASREAQDCSWIVYWSDGFNPDRYLNIGDPKTWPTKEYTWLGQSDLNYYFNGTDKILWPNVQWNETEIIINDCSFVEELSSLNCEDTRLARLMDTPCLTLSLGQSGGTLANGTYFALIAYSIDGQKVTDYFSQSNYQFVYSPNDLQGSLTLNLELDSENFDEYQLVIVSSTNEQTVATQFGYYSTRTTTVEIDVIDSRLVKVPIENLPLQTPVFETSDQVADVNGYLLRVGPRSKFDFNYQPLANLIQTKWASVEYPADYYINGGNKTNYLRDEVYTFYIRWVYDTGDKSSSYHIPGRAPKDFNIPGGSTVFETSQVNDDNSLRTNDKVFEIYNTARQLSYPTYLDGATLNSSGSWVMDDGGVLLAVGEMGYWESTEQYPDDRPDIWNPSSYCWTGSEAQIPSGGESGLYDLCGKKIRHHKFPENYINNSNTNDLVHFRPNANNSGDFIRLMGVMFENITTPKDQEGNDIPGIVGYEILRGSREGNKTILAKGMVNNMRTYKLRGSSNVDFTGLYPNYPFNTIKPIGSTTNPSNHNYLYNDPYIKNDDENGDVINQSIPNDIFTFHSPDTMFRIPYLSTTEFKLYGTLEGNADLNFQEPSDHPKFKLLSDVVVNIMIVTGVAETIISLIGKRTTNSLKIPEYGTAYAGTTGTLPINLSLGPTGIGTFGGGASIPGTGGIIQRRTPQQNALTAIATGVTTYNTFLNSYYSTGQALGDALIVALPPPIGGYENTQFSIFEQNLRSTINTAANQAGMPKQLAITGTIELPEFAYLDPVTRLLGGINHVSFYFSEGADVALSLIYAMLPFRQYALQSIAHGYYSNMSKISNSELKRFNVDDSFYIRDNIQNVKKYQTNLGNYNSYKINNLKRSDTVVIRSKSGPYFNAVYPDGVNIGPNLIESGFEDKSLATLGTLNQNAVAQVYTNGNIPKFNEDDKDIPFNLPIASHYGALKEKARNQYGQIGSEFQVSATPCEQQLSKINSIGVINYNCPIDSTQYDLTKIFRSPIIFGGDTYINRYTEKNNMMFFDNWLFDEPDGFEYNYYLHSMIPQTRFKLNSIKYDVTDLASVINFSSPSIPGTGSFPRAFFNMDYYKSSSRKYNYTDDTEDGFPDKYPGFFGIKESYFYLANSSIRDFFVESEVLIDFRKQSDNLGAKYYNPYNYTDYPSMFNMDPNIMGRLSAYLYDYSLSVSKLLNQYFSVGNTQSRYYDPQVAELCYTYYPDRIIYSLPQQIEAVKDSWFIYLVNNYKEFQNQISGVKPIGKTGIFITFKNSSPLLMSGVDERESYIGVKATIGDGGLFASTPQNISNADKSYEYGSSQNRLSVISSPAGIFYMSQDQGRIFAYNSGLQEISQAGMKWWFLLYLPYRLIKDFPDYPYLDNPVAGIGCQSTYDSSNSVLYFCKKDYYLKDEFKGRVKYIPVNSDGTGDYFLLDDNRNLIYNLGDSYIFEDASWTISYDPKFKFWISFHEWHPDLLLPTKDIFLSSKNNGLWKHNFLCDSFCNFYDEQFGVELEFPIVSGQNVMTTRSMEYILECYRRQSGNCVDQHHVLDYNFDQAIVYNSEQVSGYLNLNIYPKNDINLSLQYPKLNGNLNSYDILYSKEEQKYRFNQFWDITKDRAEFPKGSNYPPTGPLVPGTTILQGNYASENTWVTSQDGHTRVLNPDNLNYNKSELERKKFRHYLNFLTLKREQCDDVNMIIKLSNSKNQISIR